MSKNTYDIQFEEWLNVIGKQSLYLKFVINDIITSSKNVSELKFFRDSEQSSYRDEEEQNIQININSSNIQIFEDLVFLFRDADNPMISYRDFDSATDYADAKIKAQYKAYGQGCKMILHHLALVSLQEIEQVFNMNRDEIISYIKTLREKSNLSIEEYLETKIHDKTYFISDWEEWNNDNHDSLVTVIGNMDIDFIEAN